MYLTNSIRLKTAFLITVLCLLAIPISGFAGGATNDDNTLIFSKTSALANGSETISVTMSLSQGYVCPESSSVYTYSKPCADGSTSTLVARSGQQRSLYISGTGNTVSPAVGTSDAQGKVYFTVTSTVAEAKTLTGHSCNSYPPCGVYGVSGSVTFVTAAAPAPAPAPKPAPAAAPKPVAKVVEPPSAPATSEIKLGDKAIVAGQTTKTDLTKPLTLIGKTVAKGVVKLFIFSEPTEATVTADDTGNWTYSVTDLPPGDHHIEAEVTDPATGKTSARNPSVLAFTVTEKPKPTVVAQTVAPEKVKPKSWFVPAGVVLLAGLAVGVYFAKRHLKAKKMPAATETPFVAPIEPTTTAADTSEPPTVPTETPEPPK